MSKLSYIRFATYSMLAAAFLWPAPKRYVIPVDLVAPYEESYAATFEKLYRKRQASEDVARSPGFEATKKSGSEVMQLALDLARKSGDDLSDYRPPTITLYRKDGKMEWIVHWELKGMPVPGGFFAVTVDDETGATKLHPGM